MLAMHVGRKHSFLARAPALPRTRYSTKLRVAGRGVGGRAEGPTGRQPLGGRKPAARFVGLRTELRSSGWARGVCETIIDQIASTGPPPPARATESASARRPSSSSSLSMPAFASIASASAGQSWPATSTLLAFKLTLPHGVSRGSDAQPPSGPAGGAHEHVGANSARAQPPLTDWLW